jgi:hypothetical protein
MAIKTLETDRKNRMVKAIRQSADRKVVLDRVKLEPVEGYKTLLRLRNFAKCDFGIIRARDQREAHRLLSARTVSLTIGWDHNRNETVLANFLTQ